MIIFYEIFEKCRSSIFNHIKLDSIIRDDFFVDEKSLDVNKKQENTVIEVEKSEESLITVDKISEDVCIDNAETNTDKKGRQLLCCLKDCFRYVKNRSVFSLRTNYTLKEESNTNGWTKICHRCYFQSLYQYKKSKNLL